jgi:hypothetical protein
MSELYSLEPLSFLLIILLVVILMYSTPDRRQKRLDPAEVVALNHRLLDEISQVQLKMVDVLRENFKLRTELAELRRSIDGIEGFEVPPVEHISAKTELPPPPAVDTDLLRRSVNEMQTAVKRVEANYASSVMQSTSSCTKLSPAPKPLIKSPFLSRLGPNALSNINSDAFIETNPSFAERLKRPYFSPSAEMKDYSHQNLGGSS